MRRLVTEEGKRQKLKVEKNAVKVWQYSTCNNFCLKRPRKLGLVLKVS